MINVGFHDANCLFPTHFSIQFNIVCKKLGAERMSFYLNEAACEMRDMLMPDLLAEAEKAKL